MNKADSSAHTGSRLSGLPLGTRLAITGLLVVLSLDNLVAGIYTQKYIGLNVEALVSTYSERQKHDHSHMGMMNERGEMAVNLDQIPEIPHTVDLKLLLQDAHVHLFSYAVLGFAIAVLLAYSGLPERWKLMLIPLPFVAGVADFAGMFLLKYVADGFAWMVLIGGSLLGVSFTVALFVALYEMWLLPLKCK